MKTKYAVAPLAALAFFAAACADAPTGPSRSLLPQSAALGVSHFLVDFPNGATYPAGFDDGYVVLCKTGDEPGSFTFNLSVNGGTAFQVTRTLTAQNLTDCGTGPAYVSTVFGNGFPQTVVITEVGQPNWAITNIDILQVLAAGIYNRNGTPPGAYTFPRLADTEDGTTATIYINRDMARKVTFTNDYTAPPPPPTGNKGCTPGYWKQDHHFDSWNAPYDPTDDFDTTFGVNLFNPDITLLAALELNGGKGGLNQMARAAVAALLNAAEGFSPQTEAEVIAAVQGATPATYDQVKNVFAANNELGCPLN